MLMLHPMVVSEVLNITFDFFFFLELEDFRMDSFEPRLIPNFPIVVPIHSPFQVKVFLPYGQPEPQIR